MEIIQRGSEFLAKKGIESPRLQSELLLGHVLKVPRLKLYLDFGRVLTDVETDGVRALVVRRGAREPLQHILGSTSFCGFDMEVNKSVLVPRPETELLAERSWLFLAERAASLAGPVSFLDLGAGSGCLTVAILAQCPAANACSLDISPAALEVARRNATRHQVSDRVEFLQSDRFSALSPGRKFDLIVSNPPYIPTAEIPGLDPEVREFDPLLALDGGADGLDFYRCIAAEGPNFLGPEGRLMTEFGDGQAESVSRIFLSQKWIVEKTEADYTGRLRFVIARR